MTDHPLLATRQAHESTLLAIDEARRTEAALHGAYRDGVAWALADPARAAAWLASLTDAPEDR